MTIAIGSWSAFFAASDANVTRGRSRAAEERRGRALTAAAGSSGPTTGIASSGCLQDSVVDQTRPTDLCCDGAALLAVAAQIGRARLIDNRILEAAR